MFVGPFCSKQIVSVIGGKPPGRKQNLMWWLYWATLLFWYNKSLYLLCTSVLHDPHLVPLPEEFLHDPVHPQPVYLERFGRVGEIGAVNHVLQNLKQFHQILNIVHGNCGGVQLYFSTSAETMTNMDSCVEI